MSFQTDIPFSSSSSESDQDAIVLAKSKKKSRESQIQEIILQKITHQLDPTYLPGILNVLKREDEEAEEVEIDLDLLKLEELESILVYIEACLKEPIQPCCQKKNKRKSKKRKSLHRRRLLEDMIYPRNTSSSSEESSSKESSIVIFGIKPVAVIKNQTIVHEKPRHSQELNEPSVDFEEDEIIDIML